MTQAALLLDPAVKRQKKTDYMRDWRERRQAQGLEPYDKVWARNNPGSRVLNNMQGAAKARGQECTITREEIDRLLEPMTCSMTGLPLSWEGPTRNNPWLPSPDRIDTTKGYVSGNVRIVAWIYNRARGADTDEDVIKFARALLAAVDRKD